MDKNPDAFRTISEVADDLDLPQHVLRFWESRFPQIKPLKRAGGRRFYRPADVQLLVTIKSLLYSEGYTIKGVQRLLKDQGVRGLTNSRSDDETEVAVLPSGPIDAGASDDPCRNGVPEPSLGHQDAEAPSMRGAAGLLPDARESLVTALGVITACEEILRAARRAAP